MAVWGRESDFPTFWVEETPLEVEPIVARDQRRTGPLLKIVPLTQQKKGRMRE
ncbi:hypothetical protein Golob_002531, partial [Gossypium lobatum]|nr:hypothetical protein [Gossypium lobatum]